MRGEKIRNKTLLLSFIIVIGSFSGCFEEKEKGNVEFRIPQDQIDFSSMLPNWNDGDYHDYYDMLDLLNDFQIKHPNLVNVFSIGKSVLGKDIWCIRITNEKNPLDKYTCLIDGCIHGCEWEACEACLYLAEYLLINFDKNSTITSVLNTTELYIIPILNPDGRQIDYRFNENGIDLNRNFDIDFGRIRGGAIPLGMLFNRIKVTYLKFPRLHKLFPTFPSFLTNCGRRPFSEPESKAFQLFSRKFTDSDFSFYLSCHTAGHSIIGPWGAFKPPFHIPQHELAVFSTVEDWVDQHTEYTTFRSGEGLYYKDSDFFASGLSSDWMYKEFRVPSWTFEILSEDYEMWMGQGKHDQLIHWMKTTLPVFMYLIVNIEALNQWKKPTNEPVLPKGVPPEPLRGGLN